MRKTLKYPTNKACSLKWNVSALVILLLIYLNLNFSPLWIPIVHSLSLSSSHAIIYLLQAFADLIDLFTSQIQSPGKMRIMSVSLGSCLVIPEYTSHHPWLLIISILQLSMTKNGQTEMLYRGNFWSNNTNFIPVMFLDFRIILDLHTSKSFPFSLLCDKVCRRCVQQWSTEWVFWQCIR